ncbi:hypothetical protein NA56DRAFT_749646 [Hyaloscypha hepaticicola]|uniref:Cora-domain-containing protein n=1 Tax=Hyaloscypha hepaticicola TaxID=2082293 RepID=A0A2J6Q360_9HELO|nr:hypothetical protein NA56DRAFT_749646 [Hyaloscypha hepaticicola]
MSRDLSSLYFTMIADLDDIPNDLEKGPLRLDKHNQQQSKPRIVCTSNYHKKRIKPNLRRWPWLESLDQFMDPNAKGFAIDLVNNSRMEHFDVDVIHFSEYAKPYLVIKCDTPEDFEVAMSEDKNRLGSLVIAKGLSRTMIETLGTKFELKAGFFANHLEGTELFRMGSRTFDPPARAPRFLQEYFRKAPFYTVDYMRAHPIEGGLQGLFRLRGSKTTTPRGIHLIHCDLPDVFILEKISVYKKMGSKIGKPEHTKHHQYLRRMNLSFEDIPGIILTDQIISAVPCASSIPNPVSLLEDEDTEQPELDRRGHQVSARQELISWDQRLKGNEAKALFDDQKQLALRPVLKMVESSGIMFLDHARYLMGRILTRHCDTQFPDSIPFFLKISRSLHLHIHKERRVLQSTLCLASMGGGDDIGEQEQDLDFLINGMGDALKAIEEDVRFLVGQASIQEGKIVGWVSKFATLFLPVSLLATILSISDPGYTKWAILGSLSVPFVLISIYFMFFFKSAYVNTR